MGWFVQAISKFKVQIREINLILALQQHAQLSKAYLKELGMDICHLPFIHELPTCPHCMCNVQKKTIAYALCGPFCMFIYIPCSTNLVEKLIQHFKSKYFSWNQKIQRYNMKQEMKLPSDVTNQLSNNLLLLCMLPIQHNQTF